MLIYVIVGYGLIIITIVVFLLSDVMNICSHMMNQLLGQVMVIHLEDALKCTYTLL
jgi:hypothetical protein